MVSLTAHGVAHRRLRREAREHGCMVVCVPNAGGAGHDVFQVIDYATGIVRGEIVAKHRELDRVDLDEFFAKKLARR